MDSVTGLLGQWQAGNKEAMETLLPLVYDRLKAIARNQLAKEHSAQVQTTELVHQAYLQLVDPNVDWQDRVHFFAVASRVMRRLLVDQARARSRLKRGGDFERVTLNEAELGALGKDPELLDLDAALSRLAEEDERKAQVVEYHFFGGMTYEEIAMVVKVSVNTVGRDLRFAKAWLAKEMTQAGLSG